MKFQKGSEVELTYPFTTADAVGVVNPCVGNAHGVPAPTPFGTPEFEAILEEVKLVRADVEKNIFPGWFLEKYGIDPNVPKLMTKYRNLSALRPRGLAKVVHMDKPIDLGLMLLDYANDEGIPLKATPAHSGAPFIERNAEVVASLSQAVTAALFKVFEVKYYYGQPRPEEVLGIPGAMATEYPEGCPKHPAYPAGHGAAAGATYKWFKDTYQASGSQLVAARTATLHWASYRTFAGVHYQEDNLEGWKLGAEEDYAV